MNKYSYYVLTEQTKHPNRLLYYAKAVKIHNSNDLLTALAPQASNKIILHVNACDTWKEAQEIARYWNKCYAEAGTSYTEYIKNN